MKVSECPNCKYDMPTLLKAANGTESYLCPACGHNWSREDIRATSKKTISLDHLHTGHKSKGRKPVLSKVG